MCSLTEENNEAQAQLCSVTQKNAHRRVAHPVHVKSFTTWVLLDTGLSKH